MQEQTRNFRDMKLEEEEVDGISFHIDEEQSKPDHIAWNFTVMKLNESEGRDFHPHELGYKYQILLYNGEDAEYFEAILGDVKHYVSNMVKTRQEGLVMKKCSKSEEILSKILRGSLLTSLADGFMRIAEKKAEVL
jgi:hypothetical protein